jgi:GNAT superfamily N-acetyltransferase
MQTTSQIKLRPAETRDAGEVARLVAASFAQYTPLIGKPPAPVLYDYAALVATGRVWLAVAGEELRGMIYSYLEEDGAVMLDVLAVSEAARGQGLAKRLVAQVESGARAEGARLVRVYTNAVMAGPQVLYPRLGYKETHRGESDGYMRIHYEKRL